LLKKNQKVGFKNYLENKKGDWGLPQILSKWIREKTYPFLKFSKWVPIYYACKRLNFIPGVKRGGKNLFSSSLLKVNILELLKGKG
jgi:hypothetical protein